MIPYYMLILLGFCCCPLDYFQNRQVRFVFYAAYALLLMLFAGLRSVGVDNDSINYEDAFRLADKLDWSALVSGAYDVTMERGYLLLNKVVSSVGGTVQGVFFIMSLLTSAVNYSLIYRKSPYPFTAIFTYACFFYFYRDFTQIRFALSAGLSLWAIFALIDRKWLNALLLTLVACSFHSAALVVGLLYVSQLVLKNKWFYLILPFAGLIGGFFDPIGHLFQWGGLPATLTNYVIADEFGRGGYVLSIIAQLLLIGYCCYQDKLRVEYPKRALGLLYIALSLSSFINLLFISFAIMLRLSLLLFGVILFMIPQLIKTLQSYREDRYSITAFHLLFLIYMLYYGLKMITPEILQPYHIL
ncbi:EpsG family protein [bacterium A37T11]|nr:EpsG family protein [bacterium A37T11]